MLLRAIPVAFRFRVWVRCDGSYLRNVNVTRVCRKLTKLVHDRSQILGCDFSKRQESRHGKLKLIDTIVLISWIIP